MGGQLKPNSCLRWIARNGIAAGKNDTQMKLCVGMTTKCCATKPLSGANRIDGGSNALRQHDTQYALRNGVIELARNPKQAKYLGWLCTLGRAELKTLG
jgi:hypothetical protein